MSGEKSTTKKTLEDKETVNQETSKFVADIKLLISKVGTENTYNPDQSGFQLELHTGRTLAEEGTKTVECVVQSVSSTTQYYLRLMLLENCSLHYL